MLNTWNVEGTPCNHALRALCVSLIVVVHSTLAVTGCNQSLVSNGGNDENGQGSSDNGNGGQNDEDEATNDGTADDTETAGDNLFVDGYWIAARELSDATRRGLATGSQFGEVVSINIVEDDGSSWTFSGTFDGNDLEGTCSPPITDGEIDFGDLLFDPPPCRGAFSSAGTVLTLTMDPSGEARTWQMRRPAAASPALIGLWDDQGSRIVCGYNGNVLSVLDPTDRTVRFDAIRSESGGFVGTDSNGNRWIALPDADGSELFVWIDDFASVVSQRTYSRRAEPGTFVAPLTGRWMSSYDQGDLTNSVRGQASVIFDGANLYVHQRDDSHRVLFTGDYDEGGYWSIFATFDGERFESTPDSTTVWSGSVDHAAGVIYGYWNDDQTRTFGFVKALGASTVADLSGSWKSLSSDYQTPSEPTQTVGEAQVSFDGTVLRIEDDSGEARFIIEAQWDGDHFHGEWWPADDSTDRGRWSGEVVLGGALIHGKWELGEWSFTPFEVRPRSSLDDTESGSFTVVADPLEEIAASYRNSEVGVALTIYRTEGRINRFSMVGIGGTVEMTVDQRLRPTTVVGPDISATLVWSESSTSVDITVEQSGTTTMETVAVDLSDQALFAMISQWEAQTGVSGDGLRNWIAENPGRLSAVARGEEPPLGLDEPFAKRALVAPAVTAKNATALDVSKRVVNDLAAIGGLMWGAAAAQSAGLAATTTTAIVGYSALALAASAAVAFIWMLLVYELISSCFPCTLSCFWNCGLPEQQRRACCIVGGGCIVTTSTECRDFGGIPDLSQSTCSPNPCQ